MHLLVFTLHDLKSDTNDGLLMFPTVGAAERGLSQLAKGSHPMVSEYPEDFELVQVGVWDNVNRKFHETPEYIINLNDAARSVAQPIEVETDGTPDSSAGS